MTFPSALLLSVVRIIGEQGITKADFQATAGWNREFGFGLQDHVRACSFLLESGVLYELEGRYFRGALSLDSWVLNEIKSGDSDLEGLLDFPGFRGRRKFKDDLNREIGLLGELHVMSLLKERIDPDLSYRINHVSLSDDMAGFDIQTPSVSGVWEEVYLEVKTSSRQDGDNTFYLTRNEARIGARETNWFLVFVSLSPEGPKLRGHLPFDEIRPHLPRNRPDGLMWTEATGKIPLDNLFAGLP